MAKKTSSFNDAFGNLKGFTVNSPPSKELKQELPNKESKPTVSDEEIFIRAMQGTKRLEPPVQKKAKAGVQTPQKTATAHPPTLSKQTHATRKREVLERKTFLDAVGTLQITPKFSDHIMEEPARALAGNRLKQVQRGIVLLDRQLDLHGLNRDEALDALVPFLRSARQAGNKAVLVITGKGKHSSDGPVLNQVIGAWLRSHSHDQIAEFFPAPPEFGGDGALVVFLRPRNLTSDAGEN